MLVGIRDLYVRQGNGLVRGVCRPQLREFNALEGVKIRSSGDGVQVFSNVRIEGRVARSKLVRSQEYSDASDWSSRNSIAGSPSRTQIISVTTGESHSLSWPRQQRNSQNRIHGPRNGQSVRRGPTRRSHDETVPKISLRSTSYHLESVEYLPRFLPRGSCRNQST